MQTLINIGPSCFDAFEPPMAIFGSKLSLNTQNLLIFYRCRWVGACCHKANDSQLHNNTYCHHEPIHVSLLPWGSNTTNFAPLWVRHLHAGGGLCGRYSPYLGHVAVLHGRTDSWACCPHNGAPPAAPDGSQRLHTNLGDLGSPNRIGGCSLTQGVIYHRQ